MHEVSKHSLCQPVYGRYQVSQRVYFKISPTKLRDYSERLMPSYFQNGICYGYTEGITLNGAIMLSEEYLKEAATKFARFHSIEYEFSNFPFKTRYDRVSDELREIFYGRREKIYKFMNHRFICCFFRKS